MIVHSEVINCMNRKNLVIDTSVLLYDKTSIHSFPGNTVIIPITVLDEIDKHKEKPGIIGENARYVNRYLDNLRSKGSLHEGVCIEEEQVIKVLTRVPSEMLSDCDLSADVSDNKILSAGLFMQNKEPESTAKIITKDINLRVKCDALGIDSEDYYKDNIRIEDAENYKSCVTLNVSKQDIADVYENRCIEIEGAEEIFENALVVLKSDDGTNSSALCINRSGSLHLLRNEPTKSDVQPRNKEQIYALSILENQTIPLVCLTGIAGSGKTFLTLMTGLESVMSGDYDRIIVTRSVQPVGKDIGFLPGDLHEKMQPWMSPIADNLRHAVKDLTYFQVMIEKGTIEIAPLSFIRGRTFDNCFVIVDEAQNTTIHELKTIVTRVGRNSKVVLLGDTDQIDTPYIGKHSNGLSIVIDKLKDSKLSAHAHLSKGERSELATLASRIL